MFHFFDWMGKVFHFYLRNVKNVSVFLTRCEKCSLSRQNTKNNLFFFKRRLKLRHFFLQNGERLFQVF